MKNINLLSSGTHSKEIMHIYILAFPEKLANPKYIKAFFKYWKKNDTVTIFFFPLSS